jgi:hypothetical protein
MAVTLIVAISSVAYLCFLGLRDVAKDVEKQSNRFNKTRKEQIQRGPFRDAKPATKQGKDKMLRSDN